MATSHFTLLLGYPKGVSNFAFIVISSILMLSGCNLSDQAKELSGNYFYRDEAKDVKDILNHQPNRKEIYSKILAYDYNDEFIIAVQYPIYEEYKSMIAFELRSNLKKYPTNSSDEIVQSEKEADSILKSSSYYKSIFRHKVNYWIIANRNRQIYGPLTINEFTIKKRELNVPFYLNLRTEL